MSMFKHLKNAPITEALIDIQVTPKLDLSYEELKLAFAAEDFGYYLKQLISEGSFSFGVSPEGKTLQTKPVTKHVGLRMHSSDERYVAQFRLDRFTISRLPPYENWTNLMEEANRLWAIFIQRLSPTRVKRIATRYINNLRLPIKPGESFQLYIQKLIDVPDQAPQAVEAFFQRFHLVESGKDARVILTLALDNVPSEGPTPVILDIDTFSSTDLDPTDTKIWAILEQLRELKNRSFFGTITEKTLELYK